jgi:hypothetical protein
LQASYANQALILQDCGRLDTISERSDSIKVALRLATKAKPEELARLYRQVKAEDKRFMAGGPTNASIRLARP